MVQNQTSWLCKYIIEKLMEVNTAENGRAGQGFVLKYFPSVTMRSVSGASYHNLQS